MRCWLGWHSWVQVWLPELLSALDEGEHHERVFNFRLEDTPSYTECERCGVHR